MEENLVSGFYQVVAPLVKLGCFVGSGGPGLFFLSEFGLWPKSFSMSSDPSSSSPENSTSASVSTSAGDDAKRGPLSVGRRPASAPPANPGKPSGPPSGRPKRERPPRGEGKPQGEEGSSEKPDDGTEAPAPRKSKFDSGPKPAIPVPSRRGPLSDDLQAEIDAALGGLSLDAIVANESKSAGTTLENDARMRVQVVDIHGDNVFVNLGGKNQGVCSLRQFTTPPAIGDMLDVMVASFNREDNLYEVRVPGGSVVTGDWNSIQENSLVDAKITAANTGGLECQVGNLRGFIPAGQISLYRVENLGDFVGQKMLCVVTEANERRGNLVLSRRAVLEREKEESKKETLAKIQVGETLDGTVRKIHDFGAFVDIGGVDGLIHISQMSWDRVKHPSEVVAEGQKVRVRIEKMDPATGKISLSLKNPEEDPWSNIEQKYPVGSTIRGAVTRLAQFGAFVRVAPGVEGLIHISELAHHRVYAVQNVVQEGQEVEAKVLAVDTDQQRMSLSLKATLQKATKEEKPAEVEAPDEPPRALAVPKRRGPLKGGTGKGSGGESFGLNW